MSFGETAWRRKKRAWARRSYLNNQLGVLMYRQIKHLMERDNG